MLSKVHHIGPMSVGVLVVSSATPPSLSAETTSCNEIRHFLFFTSSSSPRHRRKSMATWALEYLRNVFVGSRAKHEKNLAVFQKVKPTCFFHKHKKGHRPSSSSSGDDRRPPCNCASPEARSGHRIFSDGRYVYLIGGYNPERDKSASEVQFVPFHEEAGPDDPLLREVWAFNVLSDTWKKLSTKGKCPSEMASFSMCPDVSFTRLVMFGGTGIPFGNSAVNKTRILYLRGPKRLHWEQLSCEGDIPVAGYGQAMMRQNDRVFYVVGGTTGFEYNMRVSRLIMPDPAEVSRAQTERFETPKGQWTHQLTGPEGNNPRYRHEAFLVDNKILVFGGGTRDMVVSLEKLDTFDLATNVWSQTTTMPDAIHGYPSGRRCHAAVEFDGFVYIIGGCSGHQGIANNLPPGANNSELAIYNDVWALNLKRVEWQKLNAKLPKRVYFHSAAVTPDGCLYVFGGVLDGSAQRRSAALHRIWLRPPSLVNFAARSLLKSRPELRNCSDRELRIFGVPPSLAAWLNSDDLADPAA
uniref:Kelch repeat protein n=1 Tax=Plectus sambesii TaxID=2011161 RepID=A0A914VQH9_9BILA